LREPIEYILVVLREVLPHGAELRQSMFFITIYYSILHGTTPVVLDEEEVGG
jgi:hypothetical protein